MGWGGEPQRSVALSWKLALACDFQIVDGLPWQLHEYLRLNVALMPVRRGRQLVFSVLIESSRRTRL